MIVNTKCAEQAKRINAAKTRQEHGELLALHTAWRQGVIDSGKFLSDYIIDNLVQDPNNIRPIKAGIFQDWEPSA